MTRGGAQSAPVEPAGSVVVLRALGLGDLCTGLPALRAVRRAFSGHRLLVAAPRWQEPLLRSAAAVDAVADVAGLAPLPAAIADVAVAVNLHGRGPESTERLLATRPSRLIAFEHPTLPATQGSPRWRAHEHDVDRWCRLLDESGVRADASDLLLPAPDVASPVEPGTVIVHPGATSAGRRWPADRFARVVQGVAGRGFDVALTGSAGEVVLCDQVAALAGVPVTMLAGRTSLVELDAAVAVAGAVVCNDTGIAHLASAHETPSVVLFGPTPPSEWGPPDRGPHRALWSGRSGDPHADVVHDGLLQIDVDEVLDALAEVLPARV